MTPHSQPASGAGHQAAIAVVIVNYNAGEFLVPCLEALARQTQPAERVIVVDNGTTDGSMEGIVESFPFVQVCPLESNIGFAGANNRAIALVDDCDWVALLNPDTKASEQWLESLRRAIIEHRDVDMFSSRLVDGGDPARLDGTGDHYHVSGLVWRRDHGAPSTTSRAPSEAVFSPCAAAGLYRLALLRQAGGFDERYFCYNEDIDLAFRMRLLGANCLHLDQCVVAHAGSGITGAHSDFTVYHGHRNLVWTYFKNMPTSLLWRYLPLHILMNLVTVAYYVFRGRPGVILRAKRDAILGLGRILRTRREVQRRSRVTPESIRQILVPGVMTLFRRHG